MRKLLLLLLLPALAHAQGLSLTAPRQSSVGKVLASFPLTTSGPLITEDANTVAHVYWNGSALVDTKGNAWTMNGTVPQVTANPFTTTRYGAGPFTTSNYYSLGTGNDVLDFAGDFTGCIVYAGGDGASDQGLFTNGAYGASGSGYTVDAWTSSRMFWVTYGAASANTQTTLTATPGPLHIVCFGRSSTTQYGKIDLAATQSNAGSILTPGTTVVAMLGRGTLGFTGTIYEAWFTTTPWNEATVTAIQQKVLGHFDGTSPLSVTRNVSNATYLNGSCAGTNQCLWTAPANVARITTDGLLVEPQRINYALQSNTMSTGTAATSPWALLNVTVTTVAGAPLTGTWAEVTSASNAGAVYQDVGSVTASSLSGSVWAAAVSGTTQATVQAGCATSGNVPTSCSCVRSDGGACTASIYSTNYCSAVATVGTTPVRLSVSLGCTSSTATPRLLVHAGERGVSTGTTRFTGAQLEVGTYPTSLIVTTGTSATRNADQVSATVPAVPSKWCVAGTAKPGEGRAWSTISTSNILASAGSAGSANWWAVDGTRFLTRDGSNVTGILTHAAFGTNVAHRVVGCDTAGVLSISQDGAAMAPTLSGAGTNLFSSPPTTLYIGNDNSALSALGGFLKDLKLCAASNAKGCK